MDGQVEAIKQVVEEARQEGAQVGLHAAHMKTFCGIFWEQTES